MKKTFKIILLSLAALAIIVLSGCAEVAIDAVITENNLVSYTYTLHFTGLDKDDPNYSELEIYLLDVKQHWEENGASGNIETSENEVKLTGTMEKQCSSLSEAFDTLFEFMTSEISVFEGATIDYNEENNVATYKLTANIDLTGIVDEQIYNVHPALVTNDVDEFMENIKCSATFTLPNNDSAEAQVIGKVTAFEIPFDVPYTIEAIGLVHDSASMSEETNLLNEKAQVEKVIVIFSIIAGSSLLGIIIMIVIGILSQAKAKKRKDTNIANIEDDNLTNTDDDNNSTDK